MSADPWQQAMDDAIREAMDLPDGRVVTGWLLIYETADADGGTGCGHFYGPESMTEWRALGLLHFVERRTLLSEGGNGE